MQFFAHKYSNMGSYVLISSQMPQKRRTAQSLVVKICAKSCASPINYQFILSMKISASAKSDQSSEEDEV